MPTKLKPVTPHHFRTFFAAIFGIIAMVLIVASILVVWLNRTLLDTTTYVSTVAPLVNQVDIQNFVAEKASQQLLTSAPTQDLAQQLLSPDQINGRSNQQLQTELQPVIQASLLQVIQSSSFAELWKTTNQTAHTQLISQLNSNSGELTLDLSSVVAGVIDQLKETKLSVISNKITNGSSPTVKLDLKGTTFDQVYHYYQLFKQLSLLILLVTLLAIFLCVTVSVHHIKTLRRIIFGIGILALLLSLILETPIIIAPKLSSLDQKAALAVASVLVHNLQLATLILGIVCLVISIGSKFHPKLKSGLTR